MFLPYNCTTTGRDLADSQLFGHRRGSFTGAVSDQPGLVRIGGRRHAVPRRNRRPAASTCSPSCCGFSSSRRSCRSAKRRPQRVDVRVLAATNADLEQRVAEGKFREDLYYRLAVIRIHVPPLRERREEIPHLSTYFLREALRTPRQTRHPAELGNAGCVLAVLVAGQRAPAEERDPARGGAERARAAPSSRRTCRPKSPPRACLRPRRRHRGAPVSSNANLAPAVEAGRARHDSGRARPLRRQHLRDGASAWVSPGAACI